jgi:hypothetical protein
MAAALLPPMQILGRHCSSGLCDLREAFPLGPVVLHDNRSTTNSRLELTVRQIYRDTRSGWALASTIIRFRSS